MSVSSSLLNFIYCLFLLSFCFCQPCCIFSLNLKLREFMHQHIIHDFLSGLLCSAWVQLHDVNINPHTCLLSVHFPDIFFSCIFASAHPNFLQIFFNDRSLQEKVFTCCRWNLWGFLKFVHLVVVCAPPTSFPSLLLLHTQRHIQTQTVFTLSLFPSEPDSVPPRCCRKTKE